MNQRELKRLRKALFYQKCRTYHLMLKMPNDFWREADLVLGSALLKDPEIQTLFEKTRKKLVDG